MLSSCASLIDKRFSDVTRRLDNHEAGVDGVIDDLKVQVDEIAGRATGRGMCNHWQQQLAALQQLIKDGARTPQELSSTNRSPSSQSVRRGQRTEQNAWRPSL